MIRLTFRKGDSPWIILVVGLVITILASLFMKSNMDRNAEREFTHECREIQLAVSERLDGQALILKSIAAFIETSENLSLQKWAGFSRYMAIEKELKGVQGLGFSLLIPPKDLSQHIRSKRLEGFPEYIISPEGTRTIYSSIIYMEPFSGRNQRVFGYDMFSEPSMQPAMERARDNNVAALSGKASMFQDANVDGQSGILMYFPVYRKGLPIGSVEQRRTALYGWVFTPCQMNEWMQGILREINLMEAMKLDFRIYDGSQPSPQNLLYECTPPGLQKNLTDVRFIHQVPFIFNGHRWTMLFTKTGSGFFSAEYSKIWIIAGSGFVITVLLFYLIRALLIIRTEAEKIAEILTTDLKKSKKFTTDIINSLPSHIAVLDTDGNIVSVNERWKSFAVENCCTGVAASDLGKQYLEMCKNSKCTRDEKNIEEIREGVRTVITGVQEKFTSEYPCNSGNILRWFLMSATRLSGASLGVVVSHTDITARKLAEQELKNVLAELDDRVEKRTTDLTRANVQLKNEIAEREKMEASLQVAYKEINDLKDRLQAENIYLEKEVARWHNFGDFVGQSKQLSHVFERIDQVAPMNATVLVLGETGTGKGVVARAIHSHSARKGRPMITVNCTALPSNLIESELFGRERGAYTGANARQMGRFELANGGTIFLDEIGDMALELQSKLLRVIQDGEFELVGSPRTVKVDVRIIAATNRNLEEEIRNGRFREDLYYRLNVFPLTIPPLRERKEDIPLLVNHFVDKFNKKNGKKIETVTKDTMNSLQEYHWPGNVRELESVIERAVIISQGSVLQVMDRFESLRNMEEPPGKDVKAIAELERDHILQVLRKTGWRVNGEKGAAVILGINPSTLRARIKKLGIVRQ
jgi:PAS domain S-box-containing protein